jgi:catechol 2,3-dioxygenase
MSASVRLGHVAIEVSDLARSIAFYGAVIGAVPVSRDERHRIVLLRTAGSDRFHDLALHEIQGPVRAAAGASHFAWEVSDRAALIAARDALVAHGAVRWAADFGMARSVFGVDPDGNALEISCVMPREQWPRFEREGAMFQALSPETLEPR